MDRKKKDDWKDRYIYNPDTGIFTHRGIGKIKEGAIAGYLRKDGYIVLTLYGKQQLAHRVAWYMTYNEWPSLSIDHINCIKTDNRVANLRLATTQENLQNKKRPHKGRHEGAVLGVYPLKGGLRWIARIGKDGKSLSLGTFGSQDEAREAYLTAKKKLHPFSNI